MTSDKVEGKVINYIILSLVIVTLILSTTTLVRAPNVSFEIPEDLAEKSDLDGVLKKSDLSDILSERDLTDLVRRSDLDEIAEYLDIIGEATGALISNVPKVLVTTEVFVEDHYELNNIDIEEDVLKLDVSYSGGCMKHLFTLTWNGAFAKSLPAQVDVYLHHDSNGDLCEAYLSEKLLFDLTPIRESYIDAYGTTGEIRINFHDFDNNRHKVTYIL